MAKEASSAIDVSLRVAELDEEDRKDIMRLLVDTHSNG